MSNRNTINREILNFNVVFERFEEGGYRVIVPAMPEICEFGRTLIEAKEKAREAIGQRVRELMTAGEAIPDDVKPAIARVVISIPH